MIDPDGEEWLLVDEAAGVSRVRPGTIRVWVARGTVRAHRVGARRYVSLTDVLAAETLVGKPQPRDSRGRLVRRTTAV